MSNVIRRIAGFALIGTILFVLLPGCATQDVPAARSGTITATQPTIELLGFAGCPNTPTMRNNLTAALSSAGKGWTFTDVDQETLPADDRRRGYSTPTILVNGRDLFGMPVPSTPSMGCRLYPGGVPDAAHIGRHLVMATEKQSTRDGE